MKFFPKYFSFFLAFFLLVQSITAQKVNFEKLDNGVIVYFSNYELNAVRALQLEVISDKIIHVTASPELPLKQDTSLMVIKNDLKTKFSVSNENGKVILSTSLIKAIVSLKSGLVKFTDMMGNTILAEDKYAKNFMPVSIDAGRSWQVSQSFISPEDEAFYGLGQHQAGVMNYKGDVVTLLQNNSEVAIPFLVSSKNYGILWDNYSITNFTDGRSYKPLNDLKLSDANGNAGGLSAFYIDKNNAADTVARRKETNIAYDYIPDLKNFPSSFYLDKGKVIWDGIIESSHAGLHKFLYRYGGYIKAWINDSLVLDEWRQCWNPATTIVSVNMEAGKKYHFKMQWIPDGGESYISCNFLRPPTNEEKNHFVLKSDAGDNVNYYFVYGKTMDEIIGGYRLLTGKAPIVPKWAMGFWQSRERYKTENEIISTVQEFRQQKIPIDNIVLDWQYWKPDEWGSQQFDTSRFPHARGMIDSLHHLYHTHLMISVWPKFYKGIHNYDVMNDKGFLYTGNIKENRKDWLGYVSTFYDAFNPAAGKLFWSLVENNLYNKGVDAFWMDAAEPDIYSNLNIKQRKEMMFPNALGSADKYFNAYPLVNAKVIYEGQRAVNSGRRVFTLTRSAYGGSQRYAAAVWSGDIGSRWHDMRNQISAGVNFSMSGLPYWTMDAGGFAVEHRYEHATGNDLKEWKELMTRWYQFSVFCPLFRVHGQFPVREIFNVSSAGEPAYETMLYYDKLRYRLLPYIYSTAAKSYFDNYTIMRGLVMDFPNDKNVININDEYLFGNSFLVNPVCTFNATNRQVYLPAGTGWYNLYNGKYQDGGVTISADAPFSRMPVFVKEGSIIPFGPAMQYATQKKADTISLFIYTGKNASFTLYEDDDTTYNYEKGKYASIAFNYDENSKELTIQNRQGNFPGMLQKRFFNIYWVKKDKPVELNFDKKYNTQIWYAGKKTLIKLK
ncbi:MAG: DUF5110 domain-containing protein [Bacteroidota bacterium]|nr:DUF5110 domain-containing protein [Bacteroidota bacterium]